MLFFSFNISHNGLTPAEFFLQHRDTELQDHTVRIYFTVNTVTDLCIMEWSMTARLETKRIAQSEINRYR